MALRSVDEIADVDVVTGACASAEDGSLDVLFEVPHGATRRADYERVARQLRSPLPDDLIDFFFVNTDVGAWELASATARQIVALQPSWRVGIVRCRIPRTFIDCNRRIEASAADFKAGGVTPGVGPWVTDEADRALLVGLYRRYLAVVDEAVAALRPEGRTVLLHTYAPRTVDVEVTENIVRDMRRAWQPDVASTWPMRPELDVIGRDAAGAQHAPASVVADLVAALDEPAWQVGDSVCYPLHPSTMAWSQVMARPGRTLCLEVRRDLLAEPFDPFVEMTIAAHRVARLAEPLGRAVASWN